jgi:hypothetical protein
MPLLKHLTMFLPEHGWQKKHLIFWITWILTWELDCWMQRKPKQVCCDDEEPITFGSFVTLEFAHSKWLCALQQAFDSQASWLATHPNANKFFYFPLVNKLFKITTQERIEICITYLRAWNLEPQWTFNPKHSQQ